MGTVIGVVGAYQQFEQGLPICEGIISEGFDFSPVGETMNFLASPIKNTPAILDNLGQHQDEIEKDIASAMFHYQSENYDKFGFFLGNLV
jgi:hypothetical protein